MNWFNLKDLENKLSDNSVSDKEGFYYLLANVILIYIGNYVANNDYNNEVFLFVELIVGLFIIVFGLYLTFKTNQKGDGKEYLKRYLSLSFVIFIRLFVFTIIIAIPIAIISVLAFEGTIDDKIFPDFLLIGFVTIWGVIYYYLLIRSFKKVAEFSSQ